MEMQEEVDESWSIGQLATASRLPVRTIRFYSNAGLPARRTTAGHRRYAPVDLVRLQLIRSLRSLDVDLDAIAEFLVDKVGLQDLLRVHASTLQMRLRVLQRQLAVAQAAVNAPAGKTPPCPRHQHGPTDHPADVRPLYRPKGFSGRSS